MTIALVFAAGVFFGLSFVYGAWKLDRFEDTLEDLERERRLAELLACLSEDVPAGWLADLDAIRSLPSTAERPFDWQREDAA